VLAAEVAVFILEQELPDSVVLAVAVMLVNHSRVMVLRRPQILVLVAAVRHPTLLMPPTLVEMVVVELLLLVMLAPNAGLAALLPLLGASLFTHLQQAAHTSHKDKK
jgi:hypothetical protein